MHKTTSFLELKESILLLEIKQMEERALLKEQFKISYDSLKPGNLLKSLFRELVNRADLKGDLVNATLGLATGYLSKKAVIGSTHNPLKQLFGILIQVVVSKVVSKNADGIKSGVSHLITSFLRKKK